MPDEATGIAPPTVQLASLPAQWRGEADVTDPGTIETALGHVLRRTDGTLDVYYGMADSRIGVARGNLADLLAPGVARAA